MILMHVLKHIEQFNLLSKYAVLGKKNFGGEIRVCDWLHDIDEVWWLILGFKWACIV